MKMKEFELNQNNWGVCGFVAAVQAAALNGNDRIQDTTYNTLFPIIKDFCYKNIDMQYELLDFSAVFGDVYKYKSLDDVIAKMDGDTKMNNAVGIAMTGKAMSKLCKYLGFRNYDFHGTTSTTSKLNLDKPLEYKNTIYGLGKSTGGNFRYGLLHWVYVDSDGNIMTWGKKGNDAVQMLKANGYDKITHYLPALA